MATVYTVFWKRYKTIAQLIAAASSGSADIEYASLDSAVSKMDSPVLVNSVTKDLKLVTVFSRTIGNVKTADCVIDSTEGNGLRFSNFLRLNVTNTSGERDGSASISRSAVVCFRYSCH